MSKYFMDLEFSEGMRKPIWWLPTIGSFNKPKWGIELISIGIKCEDGRTYYAVSDEFNAATCNDWVVKNVLTKLPRKYLYEFPYDSPHAVVPDYGVGIGYKNPVYKSLKRIRDEVAWFFGYAKEGGTGNFYPHTAKDIEVYAYFADYDWVVFCSLFEAMVNLPKGFPNYCKDLKQLLDERVEAMLFSNRLKFDILGTTAHRLSLKDKLTKIKMHPDYPKQIDEHNALADAEWNERLHNFINSFK